MGERTKILYKLVRLPAFYARFQDLLGGASSRERLTSQIIKPQSGMRVLDVGCGPAAIRPFLGEVDYTGVDLNAKHIEAARKSGAPGDRYLVGDVTRDLSFEPHSFDLITLIGILHHIDDDKARNLFKHLLTLIKPTGRMITFDGVYLDRQRLISKLMLDLDAGKNIRTMTQYKALCEGLPLQVKTHVFVDLLNIPYDHCTMTITPMTN